MSIQAPNNEYHFSGRITLNYPTLSDIRSYFLLHSVKIGKMVALSVSSIPPYIFRENIFKALPSPVQEGLIQAKEKTIDTLEEAQSLCYYWKTKAQKAESDRLEIERIKKRHEDVVNGNEELDPPMSETERESRARIQAIRKDNQEWKERSEAEARKFEEKSRAEARKFEEKSRAEARKFEEKSEATNRKFESYLEQERQRKIEWEIQQQEDDERHAEFLRLTEEDWENTQSEREAARLRKEYGYIDRPSIKYTCEPVYHSEIIGFPTMEMIANPDVDPSCCDHAYRILTNDQSLLEKVYRGMLRDFHPDKFRRNLETQKLATRAFQKIGEAYATLSYTGNGRCPMIGR
jgi:hypothetical protein